ncbi:hypothetical protein [Rhizobium sp. P40RR-XXII]|uniref:hypothetical protein n=1 Tax=unclassified Rhizobium TaxID=2613769 RepID=UPI003917C055
MPYGFSTAEKFIVLPYRKNRGNLAPGEKRQASSVPSAEKIAASMASRFVGVHKLVASMPFFTAPLDLANQSYTSGRH